MTKQGARRRRIGGAAAIAAVLALAAPAAQASGDTQAPSTPGGLRVTAATETTLTVQWDPARDNVGVVQYWAWAEQFSGGRAFPTDATHITFTGLKPATTYQVAVQAADAAGNVSPRSGSINATTQADRTAPSTPTGLVAQPTLGHANLSWAPASDNVRVVAYEVAVDGDTAHPVTANSASAVIRNMAPASRHTFAVRSVDTSGNRSAFSAPASLTMPDAPDRTAPAAPTGLREVGQLLWNATTDDHDAAGDLTYAVYVDGFELAFVGAQTRFETIDPVTCVSVLPRGTHTYTVRATDRSGNLSAPSNAVTITTP